MKKRTKSFILACALSLAVGVCATVGINALANENPVIGMESPLQETARMGDVVSVPDYYATVGGESVKAKANILSPSGVVYTGSKFTITEGGRYLVQYTVNGEIVHTEDCLAVVGSADMFKTNALASIDKVTNYKYNEDDAYKGVAVDIKSGATITFDREIDMANLTKNDVLFEGVVEPKEKGEADFKQMVLTFTDPTDDTAYFRLTVTDGHADGNSLKEMIYINGAANGQTAGGMNYEREVPYWQAKDIYGTSSPSSFRAVTNSSGYSLYSIKLFYDAKENAIYTHSYEGRVLLVVDFDDPVVFGGNVWGGFKSGKAVLTISFIDTKETGGRVIFNEIGGLRLDQEEIVDTVAPEIMVDLGGESKAPNALLGTEYSIFPCTAYDFFDLNVKIDATVTYKNTFTGATSDVLVKDGKFVTDKLGQYTICYTATDYTGNSSSQEYSFECIANAEEIVLSGIPEDFSAKAFEKVSIPSTTEVRAFGGNGSLKISLSATDPNGEEIEIVNNAFIPEKLGIYKITYTATDYYGVTASTDLTITVIANEDTVFMNDIILPELLIVGFEYTIPEVKAFTCYGGEVVNCKTAYFVNGVQLDETRTFVADNTADSAYIVCRAMVGEDTVCGEIDKTLFVIDGDHGRNQTAYFYDKTGTVQVTETQETIDLSTVKDGSVSFVNKLKGSAFTLGVNYILGECKFSKFTVTLTDAENTDVSVTLSFAFSSEGVRITTPYGAELPFPSVDGYFEINFNGENGIVSEASNQSVTFVDKDDKGNAFVGFPNGLYATMSFNGVAAASKLSLSTLNNQPLGFRGETDEEIKDSKGPEIETLGELPVKAKRGETITIFAARATDVLSQVTSTTVRVIAPSGQDVIAETSADKDIFLTLTETGSYRVLYMSYDSEGRRTRVGKNIRIVDSIAPTLEVKFADTTKKVGATITLPKVTVADDSGSVSYDIFLSLPNSEMRMLYHYKDGEVISYLAKDNTAYPSSFKVSATKFKLEQKGKYVLTVMAYDEDYNITMQSFTIIAQ